MEELIKALELGKPAFDGEDTNYDVATIEDAVKIIEQYSKIKKIIDEYNRGISGNAFANDKYFRRILDVFNEVA